MENKKTNTQVIWEATERKALGLCIFDKAEFVNNFLHRVQPEHFSVEINKVVFGGLEALYKAGDSQEFDLSSIPEFVLKYNASLKKPMKIDVSDLMSYIGILIVERGLEKSGKNLAKRIMNNSGTREFQNKIKEVEKSLEEGQDFKDGYEKLSTLAMRLQDSQNNELGRSPSSFFDDRFEEMMDSGGAPRGYLTGWEVFDETLGGIERKTVTTVAARPSMGKTAFGVHLSYKLAENGTPVLFFSAEMDGEDLSQRFIPIKAGIRTNKLTDYEWLKENPEYVEQIRWANKSISDLPLMVDEHAGLSIEDISWKMQRYVKEGYKVFVIDFIQFIKVRTHIGQGKDHEKIAHIMHELKTLAKKYNVAVVALAQIGRGLEKEKEKRPTLSDIKGSGSIEENSDKVLALHRPAFYERGTTEFAEKKRANKQQQLQVFILKNRNGATKDINFHYWMDYNKFIEHHNDSRGNELPHNERVPQLFDYSEYERIVVPQIMKLAKEEMEREKEENKGKQLTFDTDPDVLGESTILGRKL